MKRRKNVYLVGDFETTVYNGQKDSEVWASAVVGSGSGFGYGDGYENERI